MREIPQDLAQKAVRAIRDYNKHWPITQCAPTSSCELMRQVLEQADALEQPLDPAEVAGDRIDEHLKTHGWCAKLGPWPIPKAKNIIRQAHAEQREAVKDLSDLIEGDKDFRVDELCELNAPVRKLFGFDKEKS